MGFLYILFFSSILFATTVFGVEPVNPNASPEAKALLKYLYRIEGNQILSGQHNYFRRHPSASTDTIFKFTGKYPAIYGSDFANRDRAALIKYLIKLHQEGTIITLMYHMERPFESKDSLTGSSWRKLSDKQWNDLLTQGTETHLLWQNIIDSVAFYLKILENENIPVLWRPYHEMNGIWFWWGNKRGENGFKKLWVMTYERLTLHHKLNNLIWVWNSNAPRVKANDDAFDYELFYPGPEYVDVLAADIYHNDYKQSHHDDLLKLANGKIIAMGEVGNVPTPEIIKNQPRWTWFMIWANYPWTHNSPQSIKSIYNDSKVITKDEIQIE